MTASHRGTAPLWIATIAVALTILLLLAGNIAAGARTIQCDGSVPEWMITAANHRGGGCIELQPAWEGLLPWNVTRNRPVCLGMCLEGLTPQP